VHVGVGTPPEVVVVTGIVTLLVLLEVETTLLILVEVAVPPVHM
jgi:hypothetical protein